MSRITYDTFPGTKFGNWTVLNEIEKRLLGKQLERYFLCECQCGAIKEIPLRTLVQKLKKKKHWCRERPRKQILSNNVLIPYIETKEYNAWFHMKDRCYNKKRHCYKDYGGRGIIVCERWLQSFFNFYEDMGPAPTKEHSIDRYPNNHGNYCPENCRWATTLEQNRNSRSARQIEFRGEIMCIKEIAEIVGINYRTLKSRLDAGLSVEHATTFPVGNHKWWKNEGLINSNSD